MTGFSQDIALTVGSLDPSGRTASGAPEPPRRRLSGFARRHPWLTCLYGILGVIGLLMAALTIFLWLANWNQLRGPIGRFASARLHRHVEIDGDLKVHLLTFTPTVSVGGLKIGEPSWRGSGDMADVDRLVASVRLLPLLTGKVVMPLLEFDRPQLNLYKDASGRENWSFGPPRPNAKPFRAPPIQRFVVQDGRLAFSDETRRLRLTGVISSNEQASGPQSHAFSLKGQGDFNRSPFELSLAGGPLINVSLDRPYPIKILVRAASARIAAEGALQRPFDFGDFTLHLDMSGQDLANLYYLTGLALPNTPPFAIKGDLTRKDRDFTFDQAAGKVGSSDVEGSLKIHLSPTGRPAVTADIGSKVLDIRDVAALFGGAPAGKTLAPETAAGRTSAAAGSAPPALAQAAPRRLLPDATLATARLRGLDAEVSYRAASVKSAFAPIKGASLALTLDHGLLTVHPVAFSFPMGRLSAEVKLDARGAVPLTDADVRLSNVGLQEFLPGKSGGPPPLEGTLAARLKLQGRGDSVHAAAADANGAVTFVVPHGEIRSAFAELLGVNAGRGLSLLLAKNKGDTPIRCAVASFAVRDGVMQAQTVIFDTDVVKVVGSGSVDLGPETLNLAFKGDSKRFRIGHLLLPITLKGSLSAPQIGVQPEKTIAQGAAAVALGAVLTPFAAIIPFVDPGLAKNADCAALMGDARTDAAPIAPSQARGMKTTR